MSTTTSVLFVVTAAEHWTLADGTRHRCGYWPEELAVPHRTFHEAGFRTAVATPGGVPPTPDPAGLIEPWSSYLDGLADELASPLTLEEIAPEAFDCAFVPGGHGPMEDLAHSAAFGTLARGMFEAGRPLAAVCHGPAALLPARADDGRWLFEGFAVTAFSNVEEAEFGLAQSAPWLTEDRLKENGASFSVADKPWDEHIVVDRAVYTGQNPASAGPLARRLVEDMTARGH
ncbi:type 1 glutamine amidotransferase domain-containing protein [Streptomyces diacarni]|uniref:Type 1 glutamine amidotransferase domain-containing protein n=1 Tax=Streptomyces diacarni TaxID=2800381 RepID=A0A367F342_9ACTN|nr:type 1 glutamine amidotransferase domain-containing protein [Streptomyces diacarni]RCG24778.1 type 1 glutamine amidotransferase domain-containing protein [Streptomyces diacarni]